jgi:tripartite-type tricarboxylate transporter receptor subunit TctC
MSTHRTAAFACLVAGLAGAPAFAGEAPYPVRPLRLIVPFAPGGGTDITARLTAIHLSEALGRQVVVDNRSGAAGNLGTELAARATADGYTLLMASLSNSVNPSLFSKLPFDSIKDFEPVSQTANAPTVLVVHPSLPAQTIGDLLAMLRSKPGQMNYGSGGFGTANHVAGELLNYMGNVKMVHVPYKGGGPALADLVGGQLHVVFATTTSTRDFVAAGRLRALAVTSLKRTTILPDVPTLNESGIPGFEVLAWYGVMAPAGTPRPIVTRLSRELQRIARLDDVRKRVLAQGAESVGSSPEEFAAFFRGEIEKWQKVMAASGTKAN